MKTISIMMHIVVIIVLCFVFFKNGSPEQMSDWVWRGVFLLLPIINLYILFKFKNVKKPK